MKSEEIELLKEIFQVENESDVLTQLDKYIEESGFSKTREVKDLIEKNKSFGIPAELIIQDIRNLAKDKIIETITRQDEENLLSNLSGLLGKEVEKEAEVINTFVNNNNKDLAVKYAKGGNIRYFEEGGINEEGYRIKAGKLAMLLRNNDKLRQAALMSMGGNSQTRLMKAITKMMQDPNVEYILKPDGTYDIAGKTREGGYSAAQGKADFYFGEVQKPSLAKRLFTAGENKVDKAVTAIGSLFNSLSDEDKKQIFGYEKKETVKEQTNTNNQENNSNIENNKKENQEIKTEVQEDDKDKIEVKKEEGSKGKIKVKKESNKNDGNERILWFKSMPKHIQDAYRELWLSKNGAQRKDQDVLHKEILEILKNRGLLDENYKPVDKNYQPNVGKIYKNVSEWATEGMNKDKKVPTPPSPSPNTVNWTEGISRGEESSTQKNEKNGIVDSLFKWANENKEDVIDYATWALAIGSGVGLGAKALKSGLKYLAKKFAKKAVTKPAPIKVPSTSYPANSPQPSQIGGGSSNNNTFGPALLGPPTTKKKGGIMDNGGLAYKEFLEKEYLNNEYRMKEILKQLENQREENKEMMKDSPNLYGKFATNNEFKKDKDLNGRKVNSAKLRKEGDYLMKRNHFIAKKLGYIPKMKEESLPSFKRGGLLFKKKSLI